jgi:mono/diheme cytochrome c family protein
MLILLLLIGSEHLHAQEAGDARAGLLLAREVCASCHAIISGQPSSPNPQAPSFARIARVPGMTSTALTVALQTSHKTMSNIMLEPKDLRDVIAYITSLQERP